MRTKIQIVLLLALLIGACENNRSNFDMEIKACEVAERNGLLATAVNACEKALGIAESRNYSSVIKSRILYKLGRIKRQQGKFTEAEQRLTQSLTLEEQQTKINNLEVGRRQLELSLSMAGQNRWEEGAQLLQHLLPVIDQFSDKERLTIGNTLKHYATQLKQANPELSTEFETNSIKIMQASKVDGDK